jgi:hypothetical protein
MTKASIARIEELPRIEIEVALTITPEPIITNNKTNPSL